MKVHPVNIDIHFHEDQTLSIVFGRIPIEYVRDLFEALGTEEFQEYFTAPVEDKYREVWNEIWNARLDG
jgi:hypothetical protein